MITEATVCEVKRVIDNLAKEFCKVRGLLLTEDDLKCQLFAKLKEIPGIGKPKKSADPDVLAPSIHAEISWFDERGQLALKPDLTLIDPSNLSISRSLQPGIPFPRKGFHFTGEAIIIELKFYRGINGIPSSAVRTISDDIQKIQRLIRKNTRPSNQTKVHGFVVVFARCGKRAAEVKRLIDSHSDPVIHLIVKSA